MLSLDSKSFLIYLLCLLPTLSFAVTSNSSKCEKIFLTQDVERKYLKKKSRTTLPDAGNTEQKKLKLDTNRKYPERIARTILPYPNKVPPVVKQKSPEEIEADLLSRINKYMFLLSTLPNHIDHTLLKPESTRQDIQKLVDEALKFNFKAVCVSPCQVSLVKDLLQKTNVKQKPLIATVIGFPNGSHSTKTKMFESIEAYKDGANELDMVINIGYIKEDRFRDAELDIKQVVELVPIPIKVIIETGLLTPKEIITASRIVQAAGAHFVKTSTGFSKGGATLEDIQIIKTSVSSDMKIKASGGIRDLQTALQLLDAGVDRLGLSSSVSIMKSKSELLKPFLELMKK